MDLNIIGGLVALFIFFVLPIIIGLILIIKARAFVRARLRFLTRNSVEHLEPSDTAILIYRIVGVIFIAAPLIILLVAIVSSMNQNP